MNNKKQRLLLEYVVSSPDTFALCKHIIKSDYFDPDLRKTVDFIHEYYDKYNATPTPSQIDAETNVSLKARDDVSRAEIKFMSDQIEAFCKRRAFEQAIVKSSKLINEVASDVDYGTAEQLIRDAITISLNRDLGLDYFSNPDVRLDEQSRVPLRTPTRWKEFDDLLGGGLARKEILLFSANSGGGKSITLANLALNFLMQSRTPGSKEKMNVLYLSLELSEEMIAQRFDQMLSGVSSVIWAQHKDEIAQTINLVAPQMGKLTIKRMPVGTNSNRIRAYLKEFELVHGYVPDMIVVDYLDLMGANEHVSADNVFEKDKRATEQLRDILFDFNMFGATASQQNRSAIDAQELNQGHIAGGISKVNTVDWYVSIIMNATMKAAGEIGFVFLKSRSSDAVGKQLFLKWDNGFLRILNRDADPVDDDGVIDPNKIKKNQSTKRGWDDLFDTGDGQ
jgi:KaiC/GvpD/RAD55 family RecA-like ATPase